MATYHSEKDVKRDVKKALTAGAWMWWMPPANAFGSGNVDFNAMRYGRFLAVETKFDTNTCTAQQRQFVHRVRAFGGVAVVVSERTILTFTTWLTSWTGEEPPHTPLDLL